MNDQQIEVRRHPDPYTRIPNAAIWDNNLRLQTRAALHAMLSLPADWDYSIRGMAVKLGITKDTMARMISELEAAGYVRKKAQARDQGKFAKAGYILTDIPFDFGDDPPDEPAEGGAEPCPDSSYTVSSYTKDSPQQNTKQVITKQDKNIP